MKSNKEIVKWIKAEIKYCKDRLKTWIQEMRKDLRFKKYGDILSDAEMVAYFQFRKEVLEELLKWIEGEK